MPSSGQVVGPSISARAFSANESWTVQNSFSTKLVSASPTEAALHQKQSSNESQGDQLLISQSITDLNMQNTEAVATDQSASVSGMKLFEATGKSFTSILSSIFFVIKAAHSRSWFMLCLQLFSQTDSPLRLDSSLPSSLCYLREESLYKCLF